MLAPYAALAVGFLLLGHAISTGSLGGFLLALLDIFLWMVPWGLLAFVLVLAGVAALGVPARWRRGGGACLALISLGALAVIVGVPSGKLDAAQVLFLVPCIAAGGFGGWELARS